VGVLPLSIGIAAAALEEARVWFEPVKGKIMPMKVES